MYDLAGAWVYNKKQDEGIGWFHVLWECLPRGTLEYCSTSKTLWGFLHDPTAEGLLGQHQDIIEQERIQGEVRPERERRGFITLVLGRVHGTDGHGVKWESEDSAWIMRPPEHFKSVGFTAQDVDCLSARGDRKVLRFGL